MKIKKKIILSSKRIYLKNFTKKNLIKRYFYWFKNNELLKYSRHRNNKYKYSYFLKYYLSKKNSDNLFFAIYEKKTNFFFGTITANINLIKRSADIGILIGDNNYLRKKYGTEAWKLLINYLFKNLRILKVRGGTKKTNKGMIKIFKSSKMKLLKSNLKEQTKIYEIINAIKS